jgi:pyruvate dehydrogenase E2 component (dihydrolipoamide acetyltransferase)
MPHLITVPRLGWSMEEGVFAEWLKAPGELVRSGDRIFLLEGEKAVTEIESLDSGYLCIPADAPKSGATVKVGEVIGFLLVEGETAPNSVRLHSTIPTKVESPQRPKSDNTSLESYPSVTPPTPRVIQTMARAAGPAARRMARELGIDLKCVVTPDPTGRVLCEDVQRAAIGRVQRQASLGNVTRPIATPRARRRARELGVDWTRLVGTGRNGRIRERDVLAEPIRNVANTLSAAAEIPPTEPGRHVPASKLRRIIAQRMSNGVHQAVPVTLSAKIDAEPLVAYRERLKTESKSGLVPSYNDILIYHAALTMRALPDLNACWYRDGIHSYDDIHIATAVDTPDGLLAPVIRDADRLALHQIADHTRQLVAQARSGQISQNQLSGGTFTISNLGMYGIDTFTPVLNLPQAAILGVGRIVEEPVVRYGQISIGKTMTLSLTFDHRVVDGAPAARWLQLICERLQTPDQ